MSKSLPSMQPTQQYLQQIPPLPTTRSVARAPLTQRTTFKLLAFPPVALVATVTSATPQYPQANQGLYMPQQSQPGGQFNSRAPQQSSSPGNQSAFITFCWIIPATDGAVYEWSWYG